MGGGDAHGAGRHGVIHGRKSSTEPVADFTRTRSPSARPRFAAVAALAQASGSSAAGVDCSDPARRAMASLKNSGTSATRCRPWTASPTPGLAPMAFDRRGAISPASTASRTDSEVSSSKPGSSSALPSTRSTFQPGRVWPSGRTVPLKLCALPSALTKVPEVSVNGAMGSITWAQSSAAERYEVRATLNCAARSARRAATPLAASSAGSACTTIWALSGSANICTADLPPRSGTASAR